MLEMNSGFTLKNNPFQSFWMAGFECSDQINCLGNRVNLLKETHHADQVQSDYQLLKEMGLQVAREGIQWSVVEPEPYFYDFITVRKMMEEGRRQGIQQVWDICHFGYPDDLTPLHPHFEQRFVSLCKAFAHFFVEHYGKEELIVTPINEVSFISWLGGDAASTVPFCRNEGWNIKYKLMSAYIQGIRCLKEINPNFIILTTEPLVNIVPELNATLEEQEKAQFTHENQFQVLDILTGKICPELGGKPEYVDIIGLNYYYNNQWVNNSIDGIFLPWANEDNDVRWRSFSSLVEEVHLRYPRHALMLSETSHSGEHRPQWLEFIARECAVIIGKDIPFLGVCLYPIIDRPDWDNLDHWHHSGLWDAHQEDRSIRHLNGAYGSALLKNIWLTEQFIAEKTRGNIFPERKRHHHVQDNSFTRLTQSGTS